MKFFFALFCLLCPGLLLLGETPRPRAGVGIPGIESVGTQLGKVAEPEPVDPRDLLVKMWYIPPNPMRDRGTENIPDSEVQVDVRNWYAGGYGIEFAPGEDAIYNARLRILMVRGRAATIAAMDALGLEQDGVVPRVNVHLEVALVEFSSSKMPGLDGEISYETLRKTAGNSWHVLNQMQVMTASNMRTEATSRAGTPEEKPAAAPPGKDQPPADAAFGPLRRGESGAILEVEPMMQPSPGRYINMNLGYHFRAPGSPVWDWTTATSVFVKSGPPVVLQLDSVPPEGDHSQPAKFRALILRVDVGHRDEAAFRPAKKATIAAVSPPPNRGQKAHHGRKHSGSNPPPGELTKSAPKESPVKMWYLPMITKKGVSRDFYPYAAPESDRQVDARRWLQEEIKGIEFAPEEGALFDPRLRVLMVRAKSETLALVDTLALQDRELGLGNKLRMEISLVEFSGSKMPEINGETSFATLRQAAGNSWHVLNRMQVLAKSGERAVATSRISASGSEPVAPPPGKLPSPADTSATPLLPGEFGTSFEIFAVLKAPAGTTMDTHVTYHFRAPGAPEWDCDTTTSTAVKDGIPVVLRLDPVPPDGDHSQPAKFRALILRVDAAHLDEAALHRGKQPDASATSPPPKP